MEDLLPFLEVCGLLPAFSRCPLGIILHADGFEDVFVGEGEHHVLLLHHLFLFFLFLIYQYFYEKLGKDD